MRILIIIFFFLSVGSVASGFYIKPEDMGLGEFLIGIGVFGGFFIVMPLFLYHRWKKRDVKDYMLTKESFKKMREYEASKSKRSKTGKGHNG